MHKIQRKSVKNELISLKDAVKFVGHFHHNLADFDAFFVPILLLAPIAARRGNQRVEGPRRSGWPTAADGMTSDGRCNPIGGQHIELCCGQRNTISGRGLREKGLFVAAGVESRRIGGLGLKWMFLS